MSKGNIQRSTLLYELVVSKLVSLIGIDFSIDELWLNDKQQQSTLHKTCDGCLPETYSQLFIHLSTERWSWWNDQVSKSDHDK